MCALGTFVPVPATSIALFDGLLGSLPAGSRTDLFTHTLDVVNFSGGLSFERGLLETALRLPSDENVATAAQLYERPGRLFYESARHVTEILQRLGREVPPSVEITPRREDLFAQSAWHRLDRLEVGAAAMLDMASFCDPVGAFSGGIIHFLYRQGLNAHWEACRQIGADWVPPPSFGVLSREKPGRRERYNRGQVDKIGDVSLGFPSELQMVLPPPVYADFLRGKSGFHLTIPASEVLEDWVTVDWAKSLHPNARVLTGIKSYVNGRTPLEYFDLVLGEAKRRNIPVIDFLGFAGSSKLMRENREFHEGKRDRLDPMEVVLACRQGSAAIAAAQLMAGPEARMHTEIHQGITLTVFENTNLDRPVRFVVVDDPDVIRANEKASIDKNLEAVLLGGDLFKVMQKSAEEGVPPPAFEGALASESYDALLKEYGRLMAGMESASAEEEEIKNQRIAEIERSEEIPEIYRGFMRMYREAMGQAKKDILKALELEGIPKEKQALLPGVIKDLYGSWATEDFRQMYELVYRIFHPDASEEDWQEAVLLLKLKISQYYAVRNPCYGFCMAADRAAMMHGRWLSREDVRDTSERLLAKGLILEKDVAFLGNFQDKTALHFMFSMIPEGLLPEGVQIATQLLERCDLLKVAFNDLPESYRKAFDLVQNMKRAIFLDPKVHRAVVDLSKEFARVLPGSPTAKKEAYMDMLTRLREQLETGYRLLRATERALQEKRDTQYLLGKLISHLRMLIRRVDENPAFGPEEIVYLNQGLIEALNMANLFSFLPPDEIRRETEFLFKRMRALSQYAKTGDLEDLFPHSDGPEGMNDEGALQNARMIVGMRDAIFEAIGNRLVDLTHEMNVRFVDRAITRREVAKALNRMTKAIEDAGRDISSSSSGQAVNFILGGIAQLVRTTQKSLPKKLHQMQNYLIYYALADNLIHSRRFLIFSKDRAEVEVRYTIRRFLKVPNYLKGSPDAKSPLWFFGNGNSNTPPAK